MPQSSDQILNNEVWKTGFWQTWYVPSQVLWWKRNTVQEGRAVAAETDDVYPPVSRGSDSQSKCLVIVREK